MAKRRASAVADGTAQSASRTSAKRRACTPDATSCNVQSSHSGLSCLADDNLSQILTYLGASDLTQMACVSKQMRTLAADEHAAREREAARIDAQHRRAKRVARRVAIARLAPHTDDARLIAAVLRHIILAAPSESSLVLENGRKKLVAPPSGVCRVRVGIGADGATTMDERQAERTVDALAITESALREVSFLEEPLGAEGAALALRQAKTLGLGLPAYQRIHGRAFRLFVRGDVIRTMLANSPTLASLIAA
jgi:hypothetical protein